MEGLGSITIIAIAIASACFSNTLAGAKGCDRGAWTVGGFLLGPLALLAIAGMPDRRTQKIIRLMAESQGIDDQSIPNEVLFPSDQECVFTSPINANNDEIWAMAIESVGPHVEKLAARKASTITANIISIRTAGGRTIFVFKSSRRAQSEVRWTGHAVA